MCKNFCFDRGAHKSLVQGHKACWEILRNLCPETQIVRLTVATIHTLLGEKQVAPWMGRRTVAEHVLKQHLSALINNNSF